MPSRFSKDQLFASPLSELVDFSFDEKTVAVFPDMINRSVPGYSLMQSLTGLVAAEVVTENSRVYDLGCSLGASSLSVINSVGHHDYELQLVDQSRAMIEQARELLSGHKPGMHINFAELDVRAVNIENASLVMLNLVLQFLPVEDRQALMSGIFAGLNEGGVLLLSEKTAAEVSHSQETVDRLYRRFKKRSGYSDLEISQKRQALENVMRIESPEMHIERLKTAGFNQIVPVFRALGFVTLMAVK